MKKIILIIGLLILSGCGLNWLDEKEGIKYKCQYQREMVYYVEAPCCDQYNNLYNSKGQKICAPSGGLTGQGDGQCADFSQDACQLID